jgi:ATP-binding cassette subfamily G (WHITE) protein 5 (sterolin 1)
LAAELLLLDEPTTGLDSFTARHLIRSLADLAHSRKKMIVVSIHQPRSELFPMFDQVGLLSQGEMVYFGPQQEMVSYFTGLGHPCPSHANPFDYYGKPPLGFAISSCTMSCFRVD